MTSELAQNLTSLINLAILVVSVLIYARKASPSRGAAFLGILSAVVGVWFYGVLKLNIYEHAYEASRWRAFYKDFFLMLFLLGALSGERSR